MQRTRRSSAAAARIWCSRCTSTSTTAPTRVRLDAPLVSMFSTCFCWLHVEPLQYEHTSIAHISEVYCMCTNIVVLYCTCCTLVVRCSRQPLAAARGGPRPRHVGPRAAPRARCFSDRRRRRRRLGRELAASDCALALGPRQRAARRARRPAQLPAQVRMLFSALCSLLSTLCSLLSCYDTIEYEHCMRILLNSKNYYLY